MRKISRLAAVLVLLALAAVACGGGDQRAARSTETVPQAAADAPNVVVILTDDQTLESMRVMTRTNALLGDEGTTFSNFVTSFPLCCPSRATFLTGQYAFNHGVIDNIGERGGYYALDNINTLAVWLQRAGYSTSMVGHYLYTYGARSPTEIPPGWDDWFVTIHPSTFKYFNYNVNDNGEVVHYGNRPQDYQTDVQADRAVSEIERLAARDRPFFLNLWTLAPHVEKPEVAPNTIAEVTSVPAPRHDHTLTAEPWGPDQTPSYDEEDVSDKPLFVAGRDQMFVTTRISVQNHYQRALESLLAVDEAVDRMVTALEDAGELDNTVIVFWSDNGLLQGEHRIRDTKTVPYEEGIHVPLIIRGPGFAAGATAPQLTANIDLAPTILDVAGVDGSLEMDGESLLPPAGDPDPPPDDRVIYIQNGPQQNAAIPHFDGVRVPGYTYVEYLTGFVELYDLAADPYQLSNLAGEPSYAELEDRLAGILRQVRDCHGDSCRELRFTPPG